MATVTCHTPGCENAGIEIPMTLSGNDDDGNDWAVDRVVCGPCGQPITDIEETA